ncbi:MAG TPA: GyrI-like domain-containing protein [Anaerolineae bacterium]|nr:GyrI-like domain-containing protein [Anaerolineae bacterium]
MKKIDLRKELKHLYAPSAKKVEVVNVPKFSFVMMDGQIEPGETPETSQAFRDAMMALYGVSYTLKFMSKLRKRNPIDFTLMALEGLWWGDAGEFDFGKKATWKWTMMIMQPKHITEKMVQEALRQLQEKKDNPALSRMRFEPFHEGLCLQIMHLGPYSEEPRTIERMKAFAEENGYIYRGKHHEIYLGDPRRAKPEKLRTILRHPVEKVA